MDKFSAKVANKLLEVKKRIPYLRKDAEGHQYKYVSPSQVLGTINPILNDVGLILVTEVVSVEHEQVFAKPKVHKYYLKGKQEEEVKDLLETMFHVTFKMRWICTETGESIEVPWFASGVNGDEKGLGSALTYAERYFLLKQFNIPTDDDDPDAFQTKHMSEEDKQKKAEEAKAAEKKQQEELNRRVEQVCMDILKCKSMEEVKVISEQNQDIWKLEKVIASRRLLNETLNPTPTPPTDKKKPTPQPNGNN